MEIEVFVSRQRFETLYALRFGTDFVCNKRPYRKGTNRDGYFEAIILQKLGGEVCRDKANCKYVFKLKE